jgi:hypothetical protein
MGIAGKLMISVLFLLLRCGRFIRQPSREDDSLVHHIVSLVKANGRTVCGKADSKLISLYGLKVFVNIAKYVLEIKRMCWMHQITGQ